MALWPMGACGAHSLRTLCILQVKRGDSDFRRPHGPLPSCRQASSTPWGTAGLRRAQRLRPAADPSTALPRHSTAQPSRWQGELWGSLARPWAGLPLEIWGCSALTAHIALYCEWLTPPSLRAASGDQRIKQVPAFPWAAMSPGRAPGWHPLPWGAPQASPSDKPEVA